jgi:hypothetical protein
MAIFGTIDYIAFVAAAIEKVENYHHSPRHFIDLREMIYYGHLRNQCPTFYEAASEKVLRSLGENLRATLH